MTNNNPNDPPGDSVRIEAPLLEQIDYLHRINQVSDVARRVNQLVHSTGETLRLAAGKGGGVVRPEACQTFLGAEFGSLAAYFWRWQPDASSRPKVVTKQALRRMTTTPASVALSRDLRTRGWTFVGPTTIYAFMQAMGLVNDHVADCFVRAEIESRSDTGAINSRLPSAASGRRRSPG